MTQDGSDIILQRMMALHPKIIDLTLDRMWRLLDALGNPQNDLPPVIHIAGTNGKGSTLAMIRAGLEGAGHRVHAYTSPHLVRFHERIRLAGSLIEEDYLTEILDECYIANGDVSITYFEITTCAAILAMSRTPADYTLLEVGLGGRLDATNVIDQPALSIITPVSMDHEQFLGDSLDKIAMEKAGIIKRRTPVIVGPQQDAALEVIEHTAQKLHASLLSYGQQWHVSTEQGRVVFQDETGLLDLPLPALPGHHQIQNAGAALSALRLLGQDDRAFEAAMTQAQWPARMQRLKSGALVQAAQGAELWLDGGHNPAAGQALAAHLATVADAKTVLICGMLNTKDVTGFLQPLLQVSDHLIAVSIKDEPNTLSAQQTSDAATQVGFHTKTAENIHMAMDLAVQSGAHRILICGSLYLAGQVLRENT